MSASTELTERVILITGGSSGIGAAVAEAAVRQGNHVVIAARGEERGRAIVDACRGLEGTIDFVQTDVADGDAIERLVADTVARYGRLDCAFNNAAAASGYLARTADFQEVEFDQVMTVNLRAVWLCMKHEVTQMLSQDPAGGTIVNTSSVNGLGGARRGALYSASKAAVLALTKSAAQDYATDGIRINALAAGAFETPMLEGVMDQIADGDAEMRDRVHAQYESLVPMGRIGAPAEAAAAVLWLLSDAASYVTGHSMIVDGGMTASYR